MRATQKDRLEGPELDAGLPRRLRAEIAVVVVASGALQREDLTLSAPVIRARYERRPQLREKCFRRPACIEAALQRAPFVFGTEHCGKRTRWKIEQRATHEAVDDVRIGLVGGDRRIRVDRSEHIG